MRMRVLPARGLKGTCQVPGDKSISHRAALIGALAQGKTRIENFLRGADCLHTLACLQALGVEISEKENTFCITGRGLGGLIEPRTVLDAGNSGTTMRLLLGILTGQDFFAVITGDQSLCQRPMGRVIKPLSEMGAQILGCDGNTRAPLAIRGLTGPQPINYQMPAASAQIKSAILLAGLHSRGTTIVTQPVLCRDHTERMLQAFGASLECDRLTVSLSGGMELQGQNVRVPGDISAAAFLLVAASILPDSDLLIRDVGINPTRTGLLDVMEQMGAKIDVKNERVWSGEPVADLHVRSAQLHGIRIQGDVIPRLVDEIPVLAVAAAFAEGTTEIRDAAELRIKETDRLKALAVELSKMGVAIVEKPDGLHIQACSQLKGGPVHSWGDHRMAMALAVSGLRGTGETVISDAGCVDVSFPDFQETLQTLGASVEVYA